MGAGVGKGLRSMLVAGATILVGTTGLSVAKSPVAAANEVWVVSGIATADGGGTFTSVSCTDPADCTAIGSEDTEVSLGPPYRQGPIYATESGGLWGPATPTDDY